MGMWSEYGARLRRELEALNDQATDFSRRAMRRLDESPDAKAIAGTVPGSVGQVLGVGRGVVHEAQAIGSGVVLAVNLANDKSPGHTAAVRSVATGAQEAADYVRSRAVNPFLLYDDVRRYGAHLNKDLDPDATPVAANFRDEMERRLNIGLNQGEAAYNVATVVLPGAAELKGAAELGRFAKAGPAKYVAMGATPEKAAYLAEREFNTMGHHSIAPRRAKMLRQIPAVQAAAQRLGVPQLPQKLLGDTLVPKIFVDSPFNVVKPGGVERGQFYRQHYGLDDRYYGGPVSDEFGGGGWSGRKLGWRRYGPVERLVYGTPAATKAVVLGPPAVFDALGRAVPNDNEGG
jgi:hypothetical protein